MLSCHGCDGGRCGYSVSYTEGSSIRGHLVYDSFSFGSADGGERRVRASFGCQTYESGLFQSQACCLPSLELLHLAGAFSFTSLAASPSSASSHHRRTHPPQVADGITGLSQSQRYGPTLFDYLRAATNAPNVFSICLSEEVGALVLGGGVPSHLSAEWIPYSGSSTYAVGLTDITVGGRSIGERSSAYHNTIIDSGTTFMYLPPGAYRKVWRVEASPTQGTSLEGPILFRGLSPGLCSKRPRRSVRVPLLARWRRRGQVALSFLPPHFCGPLLLTSDGRVAGIRCATSGAPTARGGLATRLGASPEGTTLVAETQRLPRRAALVSEPPAPLRVGEYPDDYCYEASDAELDAFADQQLLFGNGVRVRFGPRQYAYELRSGLWCLGVFDNEHNGAVIGASNMRNHEVPLHARARSSVLRR